MADQWAGETGPECLRAIADAHSRCADGRVAEGWQVEGVSVQLRGQHHYQRCELSGTPAEDCPLRT